MKVVPQVVAPPGSTDERADFLPSEGGTCAGALNVAPGGVHAPWTPSTRQATRRIALPARMRRRTNITRSCARCQASVWRGGESPRPPDARPSTMRPPMQPGGTVRPNALQSADSVCWSAALQHNCPRHAGRHAAAGHTAADAADTPGGPCAICDHASTSALSTVRVVDRTAWFAPKVARS